MASNENELLKKLKSHFIPHPELLVGPGDDCAITKPPAAGKHLVLKTDAVVEGIHFSSSDSATRVGRKALARCISDFAAMAANPRHALITLGLPETKEDDWVLDLYRGMGDLAAQFAISIAGGEITATEKGDTFISVCLTGDIPEGGAITRSNARPGDAIFVSGRLGGSLLGRHLDFVPRLEEGLWIAENHEVHAMMDLSDGLATDLQRLLTQSGVGAELRAGSIPIHPDAKARHRDSTSCPPPLAAALSDGEDYELIMVVPSSSAVILLDGWKNRFPETPITCIGKILKEPGLLIRDDKGVKPLQSHGYVHFQKS